MSSDECNTSRVTKVPRIATAIVFVLALGYLFHTSHEPVLLGKYNLRYTIFLGVVFLVLIPLFYLVVRFFSVTHELRGSGGRRIPIRPRQKLKAAFVLGLLGCIAAPIAFSWVNSGQIATHDAHVFHPYLQNVPRPLHVGQHVNRWGFKGDDIELTKSDKTFRVFVFGGSTVHCGTVPFEQTHCRVLEKRLQEAYPEHRVEVQNLGAEWHCTEHDVIKLLFYAQDFSPDLVVIFHGINDLVRGLEPDFFGEGSYRPDYAHYQGAVSNLVHPWKFFKMGAMATSGHWFSDFRFHQVRLDGPEGRGLNGMITMFFPQATPVGIENWASLPAFERNLRDFVEIAQGKQMQVLLATQPSLYRPDLTPQEQDLLSFPISHQFNGQRVSLDSMTDGMRQFNTITERVADYTGVRLVDLEQLMPKTTRYLYDDVHYTPDGNQLIGDAFADEIIQWGIIPQTIVDRAGAETTGSAAGQEGSTR